MKIVNETSCHSSLNLTTGEHLRNCDIWRELFELRDELNKLGSISIIKAYIRDFMTTEVEELREKFRDDFKNLPKDDPFRIEVLITLAEIGILIYDD